MIEAFNVKPDDRGLVLACPERGCANRLTYEHLGREFRCGSCKTLLPPPDAPVAVPNSTVFAALTGRSALQVLVDFWAPWCGPCKMVAPEWVKVARWGAGRWLVVKVNTEDLPDLAVRFGIRSIPTLAAFREGRESQRQASALPAEGIIQFLERAV